MRIEAQIKHAERKREKAEQELSKLSQTESEQKRKLESLQADLETVKKAANAAQGASLVSVVFRVLMNRRGAAKGSATEPVAK